GPERDRRSQLRTLWPPARSPSSGRRSPRRRSARDGSRGRQAPVNSHSLGEQCGPSEESYTYRVEQYGQTVSSESPISMKIWGGSRAGSGRRNIIPFRQPLITGRRGWLGKGGGGWPAIQGLGGAGNGAAP